MHNEEEEEAAPPTSPHLTTPRAVGSLAVLLLQLLIARNITSKSGPQRALDPWPWEHVGPATGKCKN